jgi:hypothetical protein
MTSESLANVLQLIGAIVVAIATWHLDAMLTAPPVMGVLVPMVAASAFVVVTDAVAHVIRARGQP